MDRAATTGVRERNLPATDEYLTVKEAADLLRTPIATLYQWNHKRIGPPAHKVGRRLLYSRSRLIAWVESQPCNLRHGI